MVEFCLSSDEIMGIINSLCQNLYQSQGYRQMNELLDVVPPRLAQAMKDSLNKDFVAEEVKQALFDMAPSKAPSVDGFTAGFY